MYLELAAWQQISATYYVLAMASFTLQNVQIKVESLNLQQLKKKKKKKNYMSKIMTLSVGYVIEYENLGGFAFLTKSLLCV